MSEVRVVIPAAGEGTRFRNAGYARPKPFIDVLGRPMIEHVIQNVAPRHAHVHVLLRKEHIASELAAVESMRTRGHVIHEVNRLTEGTACTLLLARAAFDDDQPVLVANSDQYVDFSTDAFVRDCLDRNLDGSILVFNDAKRDPKWSFARLDGAGLVVEVAEKKPISELATVGIYLFRRGSDFVRAAVDMIARNDRTNNEYYTCPVYNYMLKQGAKIGVYEVPASAMHGLGTPEDLDAYLARRPAYAKGARS
jgi:NDP-sugar pyrophosphorylase family protein